MTRIFILCILPLAILADEWTAFVYMAADNDLAQWADSDLVELESVGSSNEINIVVQLDKPYVGARRLLVEKGTSSELGTLGIIDMCDWQTLRDFIEWGIRNFPAERYIVILWDHGTGWTLMPRRSFGSDWSSGNQMSIAAGDLRKAIGTAYNYTGEIIDILAFDACLMQQVEVAYEIQDYATLCVATQTTCPLQGFKYDDMFEILHDNPTMNEFDFAREIVNSNAAHYQQAQPFVISAVKLDALRELKDRIGALSSVTINLLPDSQITRTRTLVQTIPIAGDTPVPEDNLIDLGDFIDRLHGVLATPETQNLLNAYEQAIVDIGYNGDNFSHTTGLTTWFPDTYLEFRNMHEYYLGLMWVLSKWPHFLNWFYNTDDIRPSPIQVMSGTIGKNSDFHLLWSSSFDYAPVEYSVLEVQDTTVIFEDQCEDSSAWNMNGFSLSSQKVHSGSFAFHSGDASNLYHTLETKEVFSLDEYGLLTIFLNYTTEEISDSLIIKYGDYQDIHYGSSEGWWGRRSIIPPGNERLQILYKTNGSINHGGCYLDDVKLVALENSNFVRRSLTDTSLYIFNKKRGNYLYAVQPEDRYHNTANVTGFRSITIEQYATPYSHPNPFTSSCFLMLDYPDSLNPEVSIYSLSGRLVREFTSDMISNKRIYWDGKDKEFREVGSGLYFVLVKDGAFKSLGKIAKIE